MRTQIFQHNGIVGIMSSLQAEGLLNAPNEPGQLGFVIDAAFCDIQPEAIEILKQIPKSSDDIGDFDVFKSNDNKVIISWMGGIMMCFAPNYSDISGSCNYSPELLTPTIFETPQDFKAFVESEFN